MSQKFSGRALRWIFILIENYDKDLQGMNMIEEKVEKHPAWHRWLARKIPLIAATYQVRHELVRVVLDYLPKSIFLTLHVYIYKFAHLYIVSGHL